MITAGLVEPLRPGDVLADRYSVLRLVGAGARKQVHLAHDSWLGRDVAVCALQAAAADEAARLRREAALLARLGDHPSIVGVHDLLEVAGAPVMICQYLPGGALQDHLDAGAWDVDRAVAAALDVAAALSRAHAQEVVHRDVKPANIWLDDSGRAVLGDFGLAIAPGLEQQPFDLLVGTATYVAPEQLVGDRCDARSDLYSLGVVLYELLTGRPPFVGGSVLSVIAKAMQEQPTAPSELREGLPAGVDELVLRLLAKDPRQRPASADEVVPHLVALTRAPAGRRSETAPRSGFVGRKTELAQLLDALSEASDGRGGLTLLLGEPGIGKTRTALELAHQATGNGWTVLTGRCHENDVAPAFWPWTQVLQAAVRDLPEAEVAALPQKALLATLVPDLGDPATDPDPADREGSRFLLFDAAAALLTRAARAAPVVVLLDDAHWTDRASLALTRYLARELSTARVALVVCARDVPSGDDEHAASAVAELVATASRTITLGGLSEVETATYLERTLQLTLRPDSWLLRELHGRTDGNPFYVAELVRLLQSERRITDEGGVLPGEQTVPTSVRGVLHRRLRHVSPACAQLLRAMSVVGREALVNVLCHVDERSHEDALRLLDEAAAARLVMQVPGTAARFRFSHALVREALYDEIPTGDKARLHRRTMEALLDAHARDREAPAAELAHHAVRAVVDGDVLPAILWSVRAARIAGLAAAWEDAVLHYGRAVDLAASVEMAADAPGVPPFGDLLLELGDAQHRLGQSEEARLTFLRAAGEALTGEDAELLARSALGYGLGLGGFGFVEHADGVLLSLLEEAAAALGEQDSMLRMRVLARLATELYFTPFRSRRLLLSEQALEMAKRLDDPAGELLAVYSRTLALLGADRLEERRRTADRVIWLAGTQADPEMAFRGHHLRLMVTLESGALEQARAEVEACRRIADLHRQPAHDWHAAVFEAMLALASGRFDDGLQLAQRALKSGRRGSAEMAQVMHGAQLLIVHWAQGRLSEVLDGARYFADAYPYAPAWRAALAFCCTEVGRLDEAREQLDLLAARDFVDVPEDGNYLVTTALLAHVAARVGDVTRARQLEDKLRPYSDRHVVIAAGAAAFVSVRLSLGVARAAFGDLDGAIRDVTAAHQLHQARGMPAYAVWSAEELARLLLSRGTQEDVAAARATLTAAAPTARALGMRAHVARLDELSTQAGGPAADARCDRDRESVTVLISDVAGSTELTEQLGERAMHALLNEHRRAVESAAIDQGGFVLKVLGDAVLAAFSSADGALHCAARVQERYEGSSHSPLRVRIGVHTGPVLRQGDSMYGRTMILAFRVADQAEPGQVLVSSEARAAARTVLKFEVPKLLSLKGIAEPHEVHALRWKRDQD